MSFGSNKISSATKISALIKNNAATIEALVSLNPHFVKLRNPILRKLLASRVSIADACKIAGCQLQDFLNRMHAIGFEIDTSAEMETEKPQQNENIYSGLEAVELDVRPLLAKHEDPLNSILKAIDTLRPWQCLKLVNTFEPLPLINLLSKKGILHFTERPKPDLVITWFVKSISITEQIIPEMEAVPINNSEDEFHKACQRYIPERLETVNVRHLEMPLPMVTILQRLEKLPEDKALFVLHKKVPVYLLPELKERGFNYLLQHTPDEMVNILIYK